MTYPYKLRDGRWVIQTRQGNELKELVVKLDSMDQAGWDPLDILADAAHTDTTHNKNI